MESLHPILAQIPQILPQLEIYVVGGAIRDRLLGRPLVDIDLVTEKNPHQWAEILAVKLNGTAFPLDPERGIMRIAFGKNMHIDLAQRQGNSWEDDLDRRDFTINALAIPLSVWLTPQWKKGMIDRHGGLKDLEKKQIVAIKSRVFEEDPVRLLRAFRIGADLGFKIQAKTIKLISKDKNQLKKASPERVRDEILKICSTPNAFSAFSQMTQTGLMNVFFPESKPLQTLAVQYYGRGGVLKHSLEGIQWLEAMLSNLKEWFPKHTGKVKTYLNEWDGGIPRFARLKWALLMHDVGKAKTAKRIDGRLRFFNHEYVGARLIGNLSERYRWSNNELQTYVKLAQHHMRPGNLATHPNVSDKAIHRFFRDLGDDAIAMLLVSLADHLTYLSPREIKRHNSPHEKVTVFMLNRFFSHRDKVLPPKIINGHDIMETFGLKPSRIIGEILTDVTERQSEGGLKTKDEAIAFIRNRMPKYEEALKKITQDKAK